MQFLFGMLAGMLSYTCPKELSWLPICICTYKPKLSIIGFIAGFCLASYKLPATVSEKTFSAVIYQNSPAIFNKARFTVLLPNPVLQVGSNFNAKIKSDFYLKQATCLLKCNNIEKNNWYSISQNTIANCKIFHCQDITNTVSIQSYFTAHIPKDLTNYGVINALLLGQGQLITPETKQLFKYAGLAHLVAVSGLHIGIIAIVIGKIFSLIWRFNLRIFWRIPQLYFIGCGNCLGALLYAWISGFGDSSCRAMTMVLVSEACRILKLKIGREDILYLAIFFIICIKPLSVYSLGFWLSVLAVWALINSKSNIFSAQINILLVMLPVQALYKWPIGWWMPIANFIAIPIFSIFVVPAAFFILILDMLCPSYAHYLWQILDYFLTYFFRSLKLLQDLCGQGYYLPSSGNWTILLLALFAYQAIKRNLKFMFALMILLIIEITKPIILGTFKLHVLDVGQGLAIIIRTRTHNLLLDTGDLGKTNSVVLPTLKSLGIKNLDKIIVSHGDRDHSGGIYSIQKAYPKTTIIAGEPKRLQLASIACQNQSWSWDGVVFSIYQTHIDDSHNNASCILHIKSGISSVLMPGDIEANAEYALIDQLAPGSLSSEILVAAHHGSISSNTKQFINAIKPKTIIISAGNYEQYKHPAKKHMDYWKKLHIKVMNTHDLGTISL